jgi:hypothetical protein
VAGARQPGAAHSAQYYRTGVEGQRGLADCCGPYDGGVVSKGLCGRLQRLLSRPHGAVASDSEAFPSNFAARSITSSDATSGNFYAAAQPLFHPRRAVEPRRARLARDELLERENREGSLERARRWSACLGGAAVHLVVLVTLATLMMSSGMERNFQAIPSLSCFPCLLSSAWLAVCFPAASMMAGLSARRPLRLRGAHFSGHHGLPRLLASTLDPSYNRCALRSLPELWVCLAWCSTARTCIAPSAARCESVATPTDVGEPWPGFPKHLWLCSLIGRSRADLAVSPRLLWGVQKKRPGPIFT